jgi:hypothetical protein
MNIFNSWFDVFIFGFFLQFFYFSKRENEKSYNSYHFQYHFFLIWILEKKCILLVALHMQKKNLMLKVL